MSTVGILNALWYESRIARQETRDETPPLPTPDEHRLLTLWKRRQAVETSA
jgi:hypothetical protein